jgi:hypothetical protein
VEFIGEDLNDVPNKLNIFLHLTLNIRENGVK